jgi:hypothetical protein
MSMARVVKFGRGTVNSLSASYITANGLFLETSTILVAPKKSTGRHKWPPLVVLRIAMSLTVTAFADLRPGVLQVV